MEDKRKRSCMNLELHDCYTEDTEITMITHENKVVGDIRIGDCIWGMNDKCLVVEDVITGYESEIYHIIAENGCEIRVSKEHILKKITKESPAEKDMCAKDLQVDDVMSCCDGAARITSVQIEAYNDKVYNFIFEDKTMPNFISANGFWAGDLHVQQMNMAQLNQEDMEKQARDMKEEFEKLGSLFR